MRPTPDRWTYDYSPVSSAAVPGQGGLWGPLQPTSTGHGLGAIADRARPLRSAGPLN